MIFSTMDEKDDLIRKTLKKLDSDAFLMIVYPFCQQFCSFCIFNNLVFEKSAAKKFLEYYVKEISLYADSLEGFKFRNLHIGGGTPNLISLKELTLPLRKIVDFSKLERFVVEVSPRADLADYLKKAKKIGVGKIQMGVQTTDQRMLKMLNRNTSKRILNDSLSALKHSGLIWSLDFLYGFAGEDPQKRINELKGVLKLKPSGIHINSLRFYPEREKDTFLIRISGIKKEIKYFSVLGKILEDAGYVQVGDEWCLGENIFYAKRTASYSFCGMDPEVIALGPRGVSMNKNSFYCNVKSLEDYASLLSLKKFPVRSLYHFKTEDARMLFWMLRRIVISGVFKSDSFFEASKNYKYKRNILAFFRYLEKSGQEYILEKGEIRIPDKNFPNFVDLWKRYFFNKKSYIYD